MDAPFFRTFKFYGFKDREIIKKSGYKNKLIPISTVAGLSFGLMLGGTFLVESIFDWPGIGHFSVLSILTRDYPSVIGVTILYSFIYIIINFFVDIIYFIVDPRIRSKNIKKAQNRLSTTSARVALMFLVAFLMSVLIPYISPYNQDITGAVHFEDAGQSPSFSHWFGTDAVGRDVFTITIRAAFFSLKIAFGVVFFSVLLGVPIGMLAGLSGKTT